MHKLFRFVIALIISPVLSVAIIGSALATYGEAKQSWDLWHYAWEWYFNMLRFKL